MNRNTIVSAQKDFENGNSSNAIREVIHWANRNYDKFVDGTVEFIDIQGHPARVMIKRVEHVIGCPEGTRIITDKWTHIVPNSYEETHLAIFGQPSTVAV